MAGANMSNIPTSERKYLGCLRWPNFGAYASAYCVCVYRARSGADVWCCIARHKSSVQVNEENNAAEALRIE